MTYRHFAFVYDTLMKDAPYEWWIRWIENLVDREPWTNPTVVELGCGTGSILIPIAKKGFDVYGIDLSEEMLAIASQKAVEAGVSPHLLTQDMRSFQLDKTVHLIYSLCDSLNYLLEEKDVKQTFVQVYQSLRPGGIWTFDYHTEHMLSNVLGNETFTERNEDVSYIWDSSYDETTLSVTYDISFFVKEHNGYYRRFEEVHVQRAFAKQQLIDWLTEVGFIIEGIYSDFSDDLPHAETERLFFVARK